MILIAHSCKKDQDSINHIVWRCNCAKPFWEQFQIPANDRGIPALSVTLNESIMLLGHGSKFKSDDTSNAKSQKMYHSSICSNDISKLLLQQKKHTTVENMILYTIIIIKG